MNLTESIAPRSDQINADDLVGGPITYTIREVVQGKAEQPFDFLLVETDRAYRPSKTMRRVIVNAWGAETASYAGRRLTLYREPSIKFGNVAVGGIRISHMSHIDGPRDVMLQVTRGKRERFAVEPLPEVAEPKLTPQQRAKLFSLFARKGIAEEQQLPGIAHIVGRPVAHRDALTTDEYDAVIAALASQPDVEVQA